MINVDIDAYNFFNIFFKISGGWKNERCDGDQHILLTYEPECREFCIFGYSVKICERRMVGGSLHTVFVSFIEPERRDILKTYIADALEGYCL